jgi:Ni,Fe-hydrogenase III large subunit
MIELRNNQAAASLDNIPQLEYSYFYELVVSLMHNEAKHCVSYFALPQKDGWLCICCIADDETEKILALSHKLKRARQKPLPSLTAKHAAFCNFEREMHEHYGIEFADHPFLKPLRFPHDAANKSNTFKRYPFYEVEGEEVHEVGVGPIHAGIIEPGYFRFCCNAEQVLHAENVMGFQHRGVEKLMLTKSHPLQRCTLAEGIAGDCAVGHTLAHVMLMESFSGFEASERLQLERVVALELERVAMHIADTSALCGDIAYQLGKVACEALRTLVINATQAWCGNRFGKGLIRPQGSHYPAYHETISLITSALQKVLGRFKDVTDRLFTLPGALSRLETVGVLTRKQALDLGMVGLTARASGVRRDVRSTHAFMGYRQHVFSPATLENGDICARLMLRKVEVEQSINLILGLLEKIAGISMLLPEDKPNYDMLLAPSSLAISLVEGWRGEICHVGVTNESGALAHYKVTDPSLHNWWGLMVAMRGQQISDFPICNKSFNLSYAGNDL